MSAFDTLKRCEIFLGLADDDLRKVTSLPSCCETRYNSDEVIFQTGDDARHVYVLEDGQIDLMMLLPEESRDALVCAVHKGGIFGWRALVPPHTFTVTALAGKPSEVLAIGGSDLRQLFQRERHIGYEVTSSLLRVVGTRFRNIEQLLINGKSSPMFYQPNLQSAPVRRSSLTN